MKTIEEKAKAYDEAIKIIKANLGALNDITEMGEKVVNIQSIKNCFYRAFPELRDNEDERIRKEMIFYFTEEIPQCSIQEHADKMREFIAWLEKQTVQKPVEWTEKDKVKLFNIKTALCDYYTEENAEELMDWIKNHKPTIDETSYQAGIKQVLDNPESYGLAKHNGVKLYNMLQWTGNNLKEVVDFTGKSPKFDEWFKTWEDFENYVHTHNNVFKIFNEEDGSHIEIPVGAWIVKTPDGYNIASRCVFKPKSAKWSEEDEKIYKKVETAINSYYAPFSRDAEEMSEWFKSLKERCTWKPTQEQMKHLAACIEESGANLVLDSLYEQLKQLYYGTNRTN